MKTRLIRENLMDVSVIIPVYNAEKTIREIINSILSENSICIEVIVVNDGSTDGTAEILNSIRDNRLVVVNQKNKGVYSARNAALEIHRGKWVIFLDADDQIQSNFILKRYLAAEESDADVIIFNAWHKNSTHMKKHPIHTKQPINNKISGFKWIEHCVKQREWPHYLWLQIIRSNYIKRNNLNFFEGRSHKDILWTIKLATGDGQFYFLDEKDYTYIYNNESITHRKDYYNIRAVSYVNVISSILALSNDYALNGIKRSLTQHSLTECRHFLGLYRRKISNHQEIRDLFRKNISFKNLLPGVHSLSDAFFLLKLYLKMK